MKSFAVIIVLKLSILVCCYNGYFVVIAPMSFPTQEWQTKLSKQIEENQKVLEQFEAVCESKKVIINYFCHHHTGLLS